MKTNIRYFAIAFLATLILALACSKIFARGVANSVSQYRTLIVGTTNSVLAPSDTNFFAANSNLLNESVAGGSGGGNATNATQVNGVTGPLNITIVNVTGPSNGASALIISGTNGVIYITNCGTVFSIDGLSGTITGVLTNNNAATVTLQNLTVNTNVNIAGTLNAASAAVSGALTASGGAVITGGVSNITTTPFVVSNTGTAELDLDSGSAGGGKIVANFQGSGWTNLMKTAAWELLDPSGNIPIIATNNGGIAFQQPAYFSQINGVIGTLSGNITANITGNGNGLTNLNAANLTGGPIPYAVLPSGALTNNEKAFVTLQGGGSVTGNFSDALDLYGDSGGDDISIFHANGGNAIVFDQNANITQSGGAFSGTSATLSGSLTFSGNGLINMGGDSPTSGLRFSQGLSLLETSGGIAKLTTTNNFLHLGAANSILFDDPISTSVGSGVLFSNGTTSTLIAPGGISISNGALTIQAPANQATALALSNAANTNGVSIYIGTNLGSMAIRGSPSNQNTLTMESGINATNITKFVHVTGGSTNDVGWVDANGDFIAAGTFTGNGSGLTSLNASQLTSGTVPFAALPAAFTTNAGLVWITPQPGSNYLINLSAYTNTANLVLAIVCTNNVQISFTNPPSGLSFALEAFNGSALTNAAAFNLALASTNLYPVRANLTGVVTTLPTTSTNSHITSAFIVSGTNVDLCAQSQFNY